MIYTTNKGILFCVIYFQYTKITLKTILLLNQLIMLLLL